MILNKKKGFSLTEIMVVIFFMGLILSIVVINYNKDKEVFSLLNSVRIFSQNIRNIQVMGGTEENFCKNEGNWIVVRKTSVITIVAPGFITR